MCSTWVCSRYSVTSSDRQQAEPTVAPRSASLAKPRYVRTPQCSKHDRPERRAAPQPPARTARSVKPQRQREAPAGGAASSDTPNPQPSGRPPRQRSRPAPPAGLSSRPAAMNNSARYAIPKAASLHALQVKRRRVFLPRAAFLLHVAVGQAQAHRLVDDLCGTRRS